VSDDLAALAAWTYLYGFPLVFDLQQVGRFTRDGYLARALAARGGLWGNHGYEAAYPMTYTDADGDELDGRSRYTLTFDQDPPVDAFWSITMYDLPDFYLVANPIGRYSIGDRTPGLRRGRDGSLTIVIQHDQPADSANWLPARPRRSGLSCGCTSRGPPYWTAATRSRPSPSSERRPHRAGRHCSDRTRRAGRPAISEGGAVGDGRLLKARWQGGPTSHPPVRRSGAPYPL
jgi:Protein of unknown function (DUF1214)